jgi:hypothetical protein
MRYRSSFHKIKRVPQMNIKRHAGDMNSFNQRMPGTKASCSFTISDKYYLFLILRIY